MGTDGHIGKDGRVRIAFYSRDKNIADSIKQKVGYGKVRKVKGKRTYLYECYHSYWLAKIASLILNKLKQANKIKQFNERLYPKFKRR